MVKIEIEKNLLEITVPKGKGSVLVESDILENSNVNEVKILVEEGASLDYICFSKFGNSISRSFYVKKDGSIKLFDFNFESAKSSSNIKLVGEGAFGETCGLFFGNKDEKFEIYNATVHLASNTKSNMLVKGILGGSAFADYGGLVEVAKGAYGCEGYQKEDTLLLSSGAKVNAVPNLVIANNDVKCSHGVTATNLNEEKLFYLSSRGISESEAKRLIIQAHVTPILDEVCDENIKFKINKLVESRLQESPG